jgi:hypothetical protein
MNNKRKMKKKKKKRGERARTMGEPRKKMMQFEYFNNYFPSTL